MYTRVSSWGIWEAIPFIEATYIRKYRGRHPKWAYVVMRGAHFEYPEGSRGKQICHFILDYVAN